MKHIVVGIFAHPDDEAFGPGGTFALHAKQGTPTYIITATDGVLGGDSSDIAKIRHKEAKQAAKILGFSGQYMLGFSDGSLSNNRYQDVLGTIVAQLKTVLKNDQYKATFITFDRTGITGHLDHIAISMITTYLYQHLKEYLPNIKEAELHYYCLSTEQRPKSDKDYFVYCPCGCPKDQIDITKDVSKVLDIKKQAILAHASQNPDAILQSGDKNLSTEHFIIYSEEF